MAAKVGVGIKKSNAAVEKAASVEPQPACKTVQLFKQFL
jgi:hypothetical protein